MTNISGVLARVFVTDLDVAIPLYEELAQARAERFAFREVELARVGPFLLLAGNTAAYRDRTATIEVARLAPVLAALQAAGGEIVEGPSPGPNGARLIARHPDGAVFEYIETGELPGRIRRSRAPGSTSHQLGPHKSREAGTKATLTDGKSRTWFQQMESAQAALPDCADRQSLDDAGEADRDELQAAELTSFVAGCSRVPPLSATSWLISRVTRGNATRRGAHEKSY